MKSNLGLCIFYFVLYNLCVNINATTFDVFLPGSTDIYESLDSTLATFSTALPPSPGLITELIMLPSPLNTGCSAYDPALVAGKVVLVDRGGCAFQDKAQYILNAGGAGMICANNAETVLSMLGVGTMNLVIVGVRQSVGVHLRSLASANPSGNLVVKFLQYPMIESHALALREFYEATNGPNWLYTSTGAHPLGWGNYSYEPCAWQGIGCNQDGTISTMQVKEFTITGPIPNSFANLDTITSIDLTTNSLMGTIPEYFADFMSLTFLSLGANAFTGTIPESWTFPNITSLDLSQNQLTGTIPEGLYYSTKLTSLSLGSNQLEGTISESINLLSRLTSLAIGKNKLSGDFPNVTQSLPLLTSADLSDNQFTGPVPLFRGNLTTINIARNAFVGPLPGYLSTLTSLRYLDISGNYFSGVIPAPAANVRTYIASYNQFTSIASALSSNIFLTTVDFSHNSIAVPYTDITSRLPVPTAVNVANGQCLQVIDLSYNQITAGAVLSFQFIPSRWPLLVTFNLNNNNLNTTFVVNHLPTNNYLRGLDFSNNPLSGEIPPFLATIPSLNLLKLTKTNLHASGSYLNPSFAVDSTLSTYFEAYNFSCPTIVTQYGAQVLVDQDYYDWVYCECEPGFRRKEQPNSKNAAIPFECITCPSGLHCPGRQNDTAFIFEPNYYPSPTAENPLVLLPCRNCNPEGGATFKCADNHRGRMCSQCEDGFYWTGTTCAGCAPVGSSMVVISILLLVGVIGAFGIYGLINRHLCSCSVLQVDSVQSFKDETSVTSFSATEAGTVPKSPKLPHSNPEDPSEQRKVGWKRQSTVYGDQDSEEGAGSSLASLSIAINYYQTVSALSQYFALPAPVVQLLSAVKILSTATGVGIGMACVSTTLNQFENMYTAVLLEPVLVSGFIGLLYLFGKTIQYLLANRTPRALHEWEVTCLALELYAMNFLFFPVSVTAINSFRCEADPITGIMYNSAYPYVQCDAIPLSTRVIALILYSGGLLFIFSFLVILYNRTTQSSKVHRAIGKSFGFFFLPYKKQHNIFSILVLLRRFMLSLLISLVPIDSVLSFALVSLVLVVYVIITVYFAPFRSERDNYLETVTILVAMFVYALSLTLSLDELSFGSLVAVIIYYLCNVIVILWCVYEFFKANYPKIIKIINYVRGKE